MDSPIFILATQAAPIPAPAAHLCSLSGHKGNLGPLKENQKEGETVFKPNGKFLRFKAIRAKYLTCKIQYLNNK